MCLCFYFLSYPIRLSFLDLCFDFIHFSPPAIISLVFSCTSVSVFCWDFPISCMLECFLILQPWEALDSFYHCIFFSLCASVLLIFLVYLYPYWLFRGSLKAMHKESLFPWLCLFCLAFHLIPPHSFQFSTEITQAFMKTSMCSTRPFTSLWELL